jgi:hypothetical protein
MLTIYLKTLAYNLLRDNLQFLELENALRYVYYSKWGSTEVF